MNFSKALKQLKKGKKIKRGFWNAAFLFFYPGSIPYIENEKHGDHFLVCGIKNEFFTIGDKETTVRLPSINASLENKATVTGYALSSDDLLAEDWEVLP